MTTTTRHPDHPGYPKLKKAMQRENICAGGIAGAAEIWRIPSVYNKLNGVKGKFTYFQMCRIHALFECKAPGQYSLADLFDITEDDLAKVQEEYKRSQRVQAYFAEHSGLD